MIGKSLSERFGALRPLAPAEAEATLARMLGARGADVVRVRAQGEHMVACVVVDADEGAVRLCRGLGLDMKKGGTAVFGLAGADCAARFAALTQEQRAWLEEAAGARETKVLLVASGVAVVSVVAEGGAVKVRVV